MSTRLPAPARREQLLAVGLEVFARQGFHGTSMNDVADAAGVTKPVLYQHFASKRELYLALSTRSAVSCSRPSPRPSDGAVADRAGFGAYFRWVDDDRDAFLLLFGSGRRDEGVRRGRAQGRGGHRRAIEPLIAADIDASHRRTLAHALVGLAEGASRQLVASGLAFDPELISRQVADLAWAGLRGVRRVSPSPT
jgi:AcrR family transcriptional regulator